MDELSSHTSTRIQSRLTDHPCVIQVPILQAACWLNMQEGSGD